MVVDMWATWCDACKETSARVERLATAYARNTSLVVVGVNVGEKREAIERFLDGPPRLPTFMDATFALSDALAAHELPVVLVVDRRGQIVYQGRTLDERALSVIKGLLES
jgi:thiol-disulfide isomerase/thioredoxin